MTESRNRASGAHVLTGLGGFKAGLPVAKAMSAALDGFKPKVSVGLAEMVKDWQSEMTVGTGLSAVLDGFKPEVPVAKAMSAALDGFKPKVSVGLAEMVKDWQSEMTVGLAALKKDWTSQLVIVPPLDTTAKRSPTDRVASGQHPPVASSP